jgi:hypothetical protein
MSIEDFPTPEHESISTLLSENDYFEDNIIVNHDKICQKFISLYSIRLCI